MVRVEEAAQMASALPEVTEGTSYGHRTWFVRGKMFLWERPFSKADIKRFGDAAPPDGPIMALRVEDLGDKEAVVSANPKSFFTIPHFDNYPAVLVHMNAVTKKALREAIVDAWLVSAPSPLADEFMSRKRRR
jgi:hypothetical protein